MNLLVYILFSWNQYNEQDLEYFDLQTNVPFISDHSESFFKNDRENGDIIFLRTDERDKNLLFEQLSNENQNCNFDFFINNQKIYNNVEEK